MVDKHIGIGISEDSVVARPTNGTVSSHDKSTAARHHVLPIAVNIGSSNVGRTANPDVVSRRCCLAAKVERHPEVVVVALARDDRCLDGATASSAGKVGHAGARAQAIAGVDRNQLDAVVCAVRLCLNDYAMVRP